MTATAESSQRSDGKPTIVLVHGAFADASSWNGVIERLQHQGYSVVAPANPLRGVAADAAYLAGVVDQLDGPVLLVGHSYGGALITNTEAPNVDPARFREVFAADLSADQAAVMAATQRPIAAAAFSDVSGPPAWKSLPSWAVVATADKAAGSDLVRSMARRAGADLVEVEGSHVIMVSQPQAVVDLIVKAAGAVHPAAR